MSVVCGAMQDRSFGVNPTLLAQLVMAAFAVSMPAFAADDDARDAEFLKPLLNRVLEQERTAVEVPWSNPATGHSGIVRVERTFYRDRQPCRDYVRRRTGVDSGEVRGTGCRIGKLDWRTEETAVADPAPKAAAAPMSGGTAPPAGATAAASAASSTKKAADPVRNEQTPPPLIFTMPTRSEF